MIIHFLNSKLVKQVLHIKTQKALKIKEKHNVDTGQGKTNVTS